MTFLRLRNVFFAVLRQLTPASTSTAIILLQNQEFNIPQCFFATFYFQKLCDKNELENIVKIFPVENTCFYCEYFHTQVYMYKYMREKEIAGTLGKG